MKVLKPISNSRRNTVLVDYRKKLSSEVDKYPKKLFKKLPTRAGRNNKGRITTRHQGAGHKKIYRIIDFKRYPGDGEGIVKSIEYDPYRTCFISFIKYENKEAFILTPEGLKIGGKVLSGEEDDNVPIQVGNSLPLNCIPAGTMVHNIELKPKGGGKLSRSAGSYATILGADSNKKYIQIKLGSGEVKRILSVCRATIGKLSNPENNLKKIGKAGRSRWMGIRPTVRGSAMNPCDHRFGGGEGKAPKGKPDRERGRKTRRRNKTTNFSIVRSRHQQK